MIGAEQKMYVQNLLSESTLELPYAPDPNYTWRLGNNFILKCNDSTIQAYDFYGKMIDEITNIDYVYVLAKADNGLYYLTKSNEEDENIVDVYELFGDKIAEVSVDADTANIIGIDGEFYPIKTENAFPIGIFDDRPAYITENKELHLINPNGSEIVEKVDVPSISNVYLVKYGFLTFDGTLYSCIPDTELNFPNNMLYDVISYDLAVRFLCKQNADSSGVENLNRNAWNQFVNAIDIVGMKETGKTTITGVEMFRKELDKGQAGDNIGCLLRGTKKEEVERGHVLAKPGSITPHTTFTAEIYVLSKEEGGRHSPFFSNYRPQFYFRTTDVTGIIKLQEGVEMVMPGDKVTINVELIAPIAMEKTQRFAIREGGRTVASGRVTEIVK